MPNHRAKTRKRNKRKLNETLKREGRTKAQRVRIAKKRARKGEITV